jgi:hypothetical protein
MFIVQATGVNVIKLFFGVIFTTVGIFFNILTEDTDIGGPVL